MLYFIKRNQKLKEYKDYYGNLSKICYSLDRFSPDLKNCKALLSGDKPKINLGSYLQRHHGFSYEDFLELTLDNEDKTKNDETIEVLKNYLNDFKNILAKLKSYESFQGRIKFGQFERLFNFESYIYEDKQFQYSTISNYNKRLIPEFISAAFSHMVYQADVGEKIKRNMEQYFIAIMSNMDYQNFAHISQVNMELENDLKNHNNLLYVLGVAPLTFNDSEYVDLINERIKTAKDFILDTIEAPKNRIRVWIRGLEHEFSRKIKLDNKFFWTDNNDPLSRPEDGIKSKLTVENLEYIFEDVKKMKNKIGFEYYNLIVFSSSFHIIKSAIEIEKYFYNKIDITPSNIILVGNEKFFELARNKEKNSENKKAIYHKKKLKSFLYELFMHTLDKNAVK